tara:strand:- start:8760 stop:9155 length:396 start_codon:yes stop_codon:yes gene_type:complete
MFDRLFARRGRPAPAFRHIDELTAPLGDLPQGAGYTAIDRHRDFQAVFRSTPAGRRVLAQILERCRVCRRSFVPGDGFETARREGMRDAGLWLVGILAEDPGGPAGRPRSAEADAPDAAESAAAPGAGDRP